MTAAIARRRITPNGAALARSSLRGWMIRLRMRRSRAKKFWFSPTARLGGWRHRDKFHYSRDMEYSFQEYTNGKKADELQHFPINSMSQAINSWFFEDPLSAVVTVTENGYFKIEGSTTQWLYGIEPDYEDNGMKPCIEDHDVQLW